MCVVCVFIVRCVQVYVAVPVCASLAIALQVVSRAAVSSARVVSYVFVCVVKVVVGDGGGGVSAITLLSVKLLLVFLVSK